MANASDPQKRLKSIITSLQRSVECPVCLKTLKTPFKLCLRGHGVCLECTTKWEKCPSCKEQFTLENPVCVQSMLDALPPVCRYSDNGCDEFVEQGNDHEVFCGYRPIVCREFNCSVIVPITQLMDHYKKQHPEHFICKDKNTSHNWKVNIKNNISTYTPVFLYDNWFWLLKLIDVTEKQYNIFFQATPIGKLEHNYYARVTLERDDIIYTYTLKASVLSFCECKFEEEDRKDKKDDKNYEYDKVNKDDEDDNGGKDDKDDKDDKVDKDDKNDEDDKDGNDDEDDKDDNNDEDKTTELLHLEYCMKIPQSELHRFLYDDGLKSKYFFFRE